MSILVSLMITSNASFLQYFTATMAGGTTQLALHIHLDGRMLEQVKNSTRDVESAGGVERRDPVPVWQINLDVLMV